MWGKRRDAQTLWYLRGLDRWAEAVCSEERAQDKSAQELVEKWRHNCFPPNDKVIWTKWSVWEKILVLQEPVQVFVSYQNPNWPVDYRSVS